MHIFHSSMCTICLTANVQKMHSPDMELREWLSKKDMRASAFARSINRSHTTVLRWIEGSTLPSPQAMRDVLSATKGRVTPSDFFKAITMNKTSDIPVVRPEGEGVR